MNVYQIIRHEYDSDDGHYTIESLFEDRVFSDLSRAETMRDDFNEASVVVYNNTTERNIEEARRNGWPVNDRYLCMFNGDPRVAEDVEHFANRYNCLTYYTIDTLEVV